MLKKYIDFILTFAGTSQSTSSLPPIFDLSSGSMPSARDSETTSGPSWGSFLQVFCNVALAPSGSPGSLHTQPRTVRKVELRCDMEHASVEEFRGRGKGRGVKPPRSAPSSVTRRRCYSKVSSSQDRGFFQSVYEMIDEMCV